MERMTKGEGMTPEEYIAMVEEENKKLKEKLKTVTFNYDEEVKHSHQILNKWRELKETIRDHQLYEEKLEHRIIELEELLHGE